MLSTVCIETWCQIAPRSGQVVVLDNYTGGEDFLTLSSIIVSLFLHWVISKKDQIRFVARFAPYKLATNLLRYNFWICDVGPDPDYKSRICSRFVSSLYAGT